MKAKMKARFMTFLISILMLAIIPHSGHQSMAAGPEGEVKTAEPMFGTETPIPRLETTHANDYMQLLYDNLVGTNDDGTFSTETGLANKWQMSPDGMTWTFYLRKGVKFHDGVELTAKDVKFSLEQLMLPDSRAASAPRIREIVKAVQAKDPYTVIINCKKPSLFLASFLTSARSRVLMALSYILSNSGTIQTVRSDLE